MQRHTLYACIYPTTHKTAKKVGTGGGGYHIYIYIYIYLFIYLSNLGGPKDPYK